MRFDYIEPGGTLGNASRRGTKRQYPSATQEMLAQQSVEVEAEEGSTGNPSVWRHVYNLMRCPGPPCNLGPHCWIDNVGKRHYKLRTHHLESMIKFVQTGGSLQSHDDVPEDIREQIYAEVQQDVERRRKRRAPSVSSCPPINITNVLPTQSPQASNMQPGGPQPDPVGSGARKTRLQIPEPLDDAVRSYTGWQQSRFSSISTRMEYQKACRLTLDECLDLEIVFEGQDVEFYTRNGVKRGVAHRFVLDIELWADQFNVNVA
ncbi:hypothetical protein PG991_001737 [Apiospora marii]|uniref:Uncharacterized protein n=1 Tax=Apiospora marii TaxID=335849 RepID=A0ABR1SQJ4_9PEZI